MTRRIGLFGGTFDPVHHGHLRSALELRDALGLAQVRMLPNHRPAHRGPTGASSVHRRAMLEGACADVQGLIVDARELERDGPSFTVDTLEALRREEPDAVLVFFLGMDAFSGFPDWHLPDRILELAHLVVVDRPGASLSAAARTLLDRQRERIGTCLEQADAGVIEQRSVTRLEISATRIRADVTAGQDVRFLITDGTRAYIRGNGLYGADSAPTVKS